MTSSLTFLGILLLLDTSIPWGTHYLILFHQGESHVFQLSMWFFYVVVGFFFIITYRPPQITVIHLINMFVSRLCVPLKKKNRVIITCTHKYNAIWIIIISNDHHLSSLSRPYAISTSFKKFRRFTIVITPLCSLWSTTSIDLMRWSDDLHSPPIAVTQSTLDVITRLHKSETN